MAEAPSNVMIFAAGFGTRMQPLTDKMPKPLIRVNDVPLLDHALAHVHSLGKSAVVNVHYRSDQIVDHVKDRAKVILEKRAPLETGGGLKNALSLLGTDPVYTLNPDAIWKGPNPLSVLAEAWNPTYMDAVLLLIPQNQAQGHPAGGDFALDANGKVTRDLSGAIYTGVQILKTDHVRTYPKTTFSLNEIWEQMQADHTLFGVHYPGQWADVGTPDGVTLAEAMLNNV